MTKTTKEFELAYSKLNPEQRLAVDTLDGPVMLVAGPGTGKTQTLALRIANILLNTQTLPSSILALTFTDAAATNMRLRLFGLIGETAYAVRITTFHSFCNDIIKDNADLFEIPEHHDSLSDLSRYKLIEALLLETSAHKLRPINAPSLYVPEIIRSLSDLKREGVSPNDFQDISKKDEAWLQANKDELKKIEFTKMSSDLIKNLELAQIYALYQKYLSDHRTFDFDDMINLVNARLDQDPDFKASYQEIYHYFLIDEYQDTNTAQNKVVENLASHWGPSANIFVVGDTNQSIMRFQGASLANTLTFLKKYPLATHIKLTKNYRSPQFVLDAAYSVISHNPTAFQLVQLSSNNTQTGSVNIIEAQSDIDELEYLKDSVSSLLSIGVKARDIAIIYHNNSDADPIAHTLSELAIPYRLNHGGNLLQDFLIRQFLRILAVINKLKSSQDDTDLFIMLNYPWFGLSPLEVLRLARSSSQSKTSLFEVISDTPVGKKLVDYLAYDANHTLIELVEHVLKDSGMLNHLLSLKDNHIHLTRFRILFDTIKDMLHANHDLHLSDFLIDLDLMQTHGLKISDPSFAVAGQAVTLTTAHSAKGLEWDHVFVYKCIDGQWGNRKMPKLINLPESIVPESATLKAEKNEDERRLFYVALTRAKVSCTVTYAAEYRKNGKAKSVIPSMFVAELGSHCPTLKIEPKSQVLSFESSSYENLEIDELEFLNSTLSNFRLSVTALNNYLRCPYYFKLQNLIKVPHAKESYLALGTAVHAALQWLYQYKKETGLVATLSELLHHFHLSLGHELLSKTDSRLRSLQGDKILSSYYELHSADMGEALFLEKYFGYGTSKILLGDIELTGATDRIDLLSSVYKTIRVVDYKTGKPKSQKEILDQDYKRQLVFYKLLIELDQNFKYKVGETQLDFVESASLTGKSGQRTFVITQDEVQDLILEIKDVMKKIRGLEFPRTADLSTCEKCPFRDHCYPSGLPKY